MGHSEAQVQTFVKDMSELLAFHEKFVGQEEHASSQKGGNNRHFPKEKFQQKPLSVLQSSDDFKVKLSRLNQSGLKYKREVQNLTTTNKKFS